jgi:hypothetical protein
MIMPLGVTFSSDLENGVIGFIKIEYCYALIWQVGVFNGILFMICS